MPTQKNASYKEIAAFPEFSRQACRAARAYQYVAARERRGFNLLCGFWTETNKLLTTAGLLASTGKIAEEYVRTGIFPRVLILDDLAVYGRGIAKSISQFKDVLRDRLKTDYPEQFREDRFAGDFQRNVDVWVYAASEKARLLATGVFSFRTFSGEFSYLRTIHDMSLQFSRTLMESGIPNTSFSFSVRHTPLWEKLLDAPPEPPSGWSRVSLRYEGERAAVYLKACGRQGVQRFKTLRFFPDREKSVSQITSFPLLGELDGRETKELCQRGAQIAREEGLPQTARLLGETHRYLQPLKAQFFVFLTSVLDFYDFCGDFLDPESRGEVQEELSCDLPKAVRNFGGGEKMLQEFMRIAFDETLQGRLRVLLGSYLDGPGEPLLRYDPRAFAGLDVRMEGSSQGEECNDKVSHYIWELGVQDEINALPVVDRPYWFEPLDYQERGKPIRQILKDLAESAPDPQTVCGRVAFLIVTMDRGLEGPMVNILEDGGAQLRLKVGELSTFYPMKKYAACIPALSRVEEFYYLRYRTKKEAVTAFLERYGPHDKDLLKIYEYEQTFTDWNFDNLTRLYSTKQEVEERYAQAVEFLFHTNGETEENRE